jgi:RNA polymerase sigma factor (sigma-70 family)
MHRLLTTLLRRLPPDDPSSDAALLFRFAQHRDQTAFELLVWRHGGLVLGVCRRVLRDEHLAEDAFQATFLILARKAGSVRGSLAGWLHQVAQRVCLRARKRNPVPLESGSDHGVHDSDPLLSAELRSVLDEEIAQLPEKQRLAVLLCYLQGRTTDDAAKFLGIPRGTVLSRLDAARRRLQAALTRRGVAVPVTLFAGTMLTPDLTAEVCQRVTELAIEFVNSPAASTFPTQLAHEVLGMTARKTVLGTATALILTAGLGTGVGLVMAQGEKKPEKAAGEQKQAEPSKTPASSPTDSRNDATDEKAREQRINKTKKRLKEIEAQLEQITKEIGHPDIPKWDMERHQAELRMLETQRPKITPYSPEFVEMAREVERARMEVEKAEAAFVNPVVLDAAVSKHPKVVELRTNIVKKETEIRNSKLKTGDPELVKLEKELKDLQRDKAEMEKSVRPEIETYLRVPQIVAAETSHNQLRSRFHSIQFETERWRDKMNEARERWQAQLRAQPQRERLTDDFELLREKRKQLMRELLDLETK